MGDQSLRLRSVGDVAFKVSPFLFNNEFPVQAATAYAVRLSFLCSSRCDSVP
jgi:hypothetical protein